MFSWYTYLSVILVFSHPSVYGVGISLWLRHFLIIAYLYLFPMLRCRLVPKQVCSVAQLTAKFRLLLLLMVNDHITKTCPCNVYPLETHFYIVKLGYAGVYLFFLFLLQNIDCGYLLEPPRLSRTCFRDDSSQFVLNLLLRHSPIAT